MMPSTPGPKPLGRTTVAVIVVGCLIGGGIALYFKLRPKNQTVEISIPAEH